MTHEDFITYKQAVKLKELGFNCESRYFVPTLIQVQKWIREEMGIDITIEHVYHRLNTGNKIMYSLRIGDQSTFNTQFYRNYDSYNEALSIGIDHAINILKNRVK